MMKNLKTLTFFAVILAFAASANAASHAGAPAGMAAPTQAIAPASADMAEGEIRKIDMDTKKITIKHGVIKSLDMPGMTMVFQVKDTAMLDKVKAGDKVRFRAEKANGAIVVTDIQPVR